MEARPPRALEATTLDAMVGLFCAGHRHAQPCADCDALLAYGRTRLLACPWGEDKPVCGACPRHCYRPAERERIKAVMRWAGPRMVFVHPILALAHLRRLHRRPPA
jgi:hypothetical protein